VHLQQKVHLAFADLECRGDPRWRISAEVHSKHQVAAAQIHGLTGRRSGCQGRPQACNLAFHLGDFRTQTLLLSAPVFQIAVLRGDQMIQATLGYDEQAELQECNQRQRDHGEKKWSHAILL